MFLLFIAILKFCTAQKLFILVCLNSVCFYCMTQNLIFFLLAMSVFIFLNVMLVKQNSRRLGSFLFHVSKSLCLGRLLPTRQDQLCKCWKFKFQMQIDIYRKEGKNLWSYLKAFSSDTPQSLKARNRPKQLTKAEFIPRFVSKCINLISEAELVLCFEHQSARWIQREDKQNYNCSIRISCNLIGWPIYCCQRRISGL